MSISIIVPHCLVKDVQVGASYDMNEGFVNLIWPGVCAGYRAMLCVHVGGTALMVYDLLWA